MNLTRRFRAPQAHPPTGDSADLLAVGQLIDDAMRPGNFFAAPALRLSWSAARAETIAWEIFRGRLLEKAHTRLTRTFLSWHVIQEDDAHPPTEPMLSVKLDVAERQIHVVRGLLAYVWDAHASGNVIESRETIRWTRELVGTIALAQFADLEALRDELICVIWQAIVGTSRLPLHSVEAPLPAFHFGQLHYVYRADASDQPAISWEAHLPASLKAPLAWNELVKLIEFVLRADADVPKLIGHAAGLPWPRVLRSLFNDVSLSPWTNFAANALSLAASALSGPDERTDFLAWLLRQLGRHLTAFDLITFHHRGANYPDALLLELALKALLRELDQNPELFQGDDAHVRRRALRQACLLRRHYEGHLVPDLPTSPGENARVLPASHPRVPQEQLTQSVRRRRRLFADEPLTGLLSAHARRVLALSVRDLALIEEQTELGLGVFIDRPLGYLKSPAEPDQTPLLAHEAFSASIARRRHDDLRALCAELGLSDSMPALPEGTQQGLAHKEVAECPRPVAALADVRKVADDFVILRTLPGGLMALLERLDTRSLRERYRLAFLQERKVGLVVQTVDAQGELVLAVFDERLRRRLDVQVDASQGYARRAGIEIPRAGLRVMRVWEDAADADTLTLHESVERTV